MYKGCVLPVRLLIPLMFIEIPAPGSPESEFTKTPEACPCNVSLIFVYTWSSKSFALIDPIAPVTSFRFLEP